MLKGQTEVRDISWKPRALEIKLELLKLDILVHYVGKGQGCDVYCVRTLEERRPHQASGAELAYGEIKLACQPTSLLGGK